MAETKEESEVTAIVANIIQNTLGLLNTDGIDLSNVLGNITSNDQVIKFITSYDINVLLISLSLSRNKPKLTISVNIFEQEINASPNTTILLIKNQSIILSKQNINSTLTIISNQSNIANMFKICLKHLYIPYFHATQDNISQSLSQIYTDIDYTFDNSEHSNALSKITCIDDEIRYWKSKQRSMKEAQSFYEILHGLKGRYNDISKSDIININTEAMLNNINELNDILHLLWTAHNGTYPNHRMRHLLHIIDSYIGRFMCLALAKHIPSPFNVSFGTFEILIQKLIYVYKEWIEVRNHDLIKYFTQNLKRWQYSDSECKVNYVCKRLYVRMNDILIIRSLYIDINKLLPSKCHSHFEVFDALQNVIWACDDTKQCLFVETKEVWYTNMSKAIRISADKLQKRITQISSQSPQLILAEFENFSVLLQQSMVSEQFKQQRIQLLDEMKKHLAHTKSSYEQLLSVNDITAQYTIYVQSQSVLKIMECHKLKNKIGQLQQINEKLIQNETFKSEIFALKCDLRDLCKELFANWIETAEIILSESGLNDTKRKVMELDLENDGRLVVHYSDNLVTLINDIRLLKEFGYSIPNALQKGYETASKFYKYAIKLKQISNFYNTMSAQIIQSQKGLLLREAQRFEQIITNKNAVSWDKPKECDIFIQKLMNASNELSQNNKRLRNLHNFINSKIKVLIDLDLFAEPLKWEEIIHKIGVIFKQESKRDKSTNKAMAMWIMFWESKLFKLFEFQYIKSMKNIENYTANNVIECNLIFDRNRKLLKFRPSLPKIKHKLTQNINRVIEKPNNFKGFGINSEVYSKILHKKEIKELVTNINHKIEAMIGSLSAVIAEYESWIDFGIIDFDKEILPKLTDITKYEQYFKFIQQKTAQTEQLCDSMKIDICFMVSFVPFKNALDDIYRNFEDSLIISLKKNITNSIGQLSEYIQNGLKILNEQPNDVTQLSNFKHKCDEIIKEKPKYLRIFEEIHNKNNILITNLSNLIFQSQYTSSERKAMDLTEIEQKWDFFEHSLLIFDDMLEEQRRNLRSNVESKIKDFQTEIEKFSSRWNALKPKEISKDLNPKLAHKITQQINEWREEYNINIASLTQLQKECEFFDICVDIPLLDTINKEISSYESSWTVYSQFIKEMESMESELWVAFRTRLLDFQDFYEMWSAKIKNIQKESNHKNDAVITHLKSEIKNFEDIWPLLRCITGELFEREHWNILFYKLQFSKNINLRTLTFGHLLSAKDNILKNKDALQQLANRAQGEVTIREAIQELQVWIENQEFDTTEHNNNGLQLCLVKGWKDLFIKIGDQLSLLTSLKESPYFDSFSDQISSLEHKFIRLDESLRFLNQIQRKWVYLQPIFSRGALPKEQSRFARIDENFTMIMKAIAINKCVMNLLSMHNITQTLSRLVDQLERCQKALCDYLENKRSKFPRFYFLGDDDMLQILGQSMNPKVIQTHLKKLYQGIYRVIFSNDSKTIIGIQSAKQEKVTLYKPVSVCAEVEVWLNNLTKEMKYTLKQLLFQCLKQFNISQYPSQILCLCQCITFTFNIEKCIKSNSMNALSKYHKELQLKLEEYTTVDTTTNVLTELKIKALILDIIHHIEVTELLIQNRVNATTDWLWLKQLRFYINKSTQTVSLQMVNAQFLYSFEYQGNATKLVHTPLTDKCYLVLTQGMHLGYGGNPYGPAGTGKTESVKALGHVMGRQVLVFNCDEAIDFKSMARIFTGLVQCGAWGCFDEFNRLKEDQLSAISQQIQIIQNGLRNKYENIALLGKDIKLNQNSGIFVTMNPASKEYGGRSKLPDNLKQLFRSVAMTKPDSKLIAQTLLYAEGFRFAKVWGYKLTELYTLSKQLLSPQRHYDWGLRALKSVLNSSGNALKEIKKSSKCNPIITREFEMCLLLKSLRINTLSKLTYKDSQKFHQLIHDVFADKNMENESKNEESFEFKLERQIQIELDKLKLKSVSTQMKKIIELNEALSQRMGVVIVGPSQCGKSTLYQILYKSLLSLGHKIEMHVMNPKACDRQQLLGYMDMDTREWFDGILTRSARFSVSNSADITTWIICDGDIDPEWIESLNSVLDDNHLLSLPNGERIQFGENVNFIFETHDLSFASPATISRMGMIYLSKEDIQFTTLIESWIECNMSDDSNIQTWISDVFMRTVEWIDENIINNAKISSKLSFAVPMSVIGLVTNGLSHIIGVTQSKNDFLVRCVYGLSCNFPIKIADKIAQKIGKLCGVNLPSQNPSLIYWNKRNDTIASFVNNGGIDSEIWKTETFSVQWLPIIKTRNVCKHLNVMSQWLENKYPFILVGSEGCGKSILLKEAFSQYIAMKEKQNKNVNIASVHCNGYTKARHVIKKLYQTCSSFASNNGKVLRPNGSDSLILYLKDINLCKPDNYNTSQLIELLQQFITYKGFYDENLEFVRLDEHIQFVFSMNHSNTLGTYALSTRFTARIGIISMEEPTNEELNLIYSNYASLIASMLELNSTQTQTLQQTCPAMIAIYNEIKHTFRREEYAHFILTLRDLTQWVFSLIRYSLKSVGIINAWYNECIRLFYDRMPSAKSKQKLQNIIASVMNKYKLPLQSFKQEIIYCTFVNNETENTLPQWQIGREFTRVSIDDFRTVISGKIRSYEKEYNELHLILFDEFLHNLQKIDRVITHGYLHNLLLIGSSGIGRKIMTKLVCYIHRIECRILKISQKYCGKTQFANTLKEIFKSAGIEGQKILLFIEDCQLIDSVMLQYLNGLVSTGDIIGLFEDKELDTLLAPIQELYRESAHKSIYDCFIARVVHNLYIVLSVDPNNERLEKIISPSLITKCSVIWLGNQWSDKSMISYSKSQLKCVLNHCSEEKESELLLQQMHALHYQNIKYGACPRTLMVLVSVYSAVFAQKLSHNQQLKSHLMSGLQKLNEAKTIVDALSIKAKQQKQQLREKQSQADLALDEITESMTKANERRDEAETLKVRLSEKEVLLSVRKSKVESELSDIQPTVDRAKTAVGEIRKDSLNELRMLRLPPEAINDVLSGVLILMGHFDTSWQSMKSFLSKPSVKQEIINFDARRITPQIRKKAKRLLNEKKNSFDPKRIQRVSVAAAPLAAWFRANISYSLVLQKIGPLENELSAAQNDIIEAQKNMNSVENELIALDKQVSSLKLNFTKITSEAEVLKISLKKVEGTLARAQTLFHKLSDEKQRWDEQICEIEKVTLLLPQYCLIVANFITYLGGYPEDVRSQSMQKWNQIVSSGSDVNVLRFMNNESDLLKWKSEGLSDDILSYENAMIILNCALFPFIIDPNGDATNWLTNFLKLQNISYETIQASDERFIKQLELSVRFGKTIVVTDIDSLNPCLYPLLRKDISKQGARHVISIGEKWIDYNPNFKLYLICRNSNFSLSSRCKPLVTQINFSVTKSGLEAQLLAMTLRSEQPELETKKSALLREEERYKIELDKLERELLQELAMSKGNILENTALIESLNNTKLQSQNIKKALAESKVVQNDLNKQRQIYAILAVIGSNAYFTIKALQSLNNMYQFSLLTFLSLFESNLQSVHSSPNVDTQTHITDLEKSLIAMVYSYILRSLFKRDRLTFGLYFVHSLYPKLCKEREWEYFIGEIMANSSQTKVRLPSWISSDTVQPFKDLCNHFETMVLKCEFNKCSMQWNQFIQSNNPELTLQSIVGSSTITDFEQLMLIQTFRNDKLSVATQNFINKHLGKPNCNISLKELYEKETQSTVPILFVTTPGADPSNELRELALNVVGSDQYYEMAMSCGQECEAIDLIKIGAQKGHWLCLKNIHLVIPWAKHQLQPLLLSFKSSPDLSPQFRLWLTTESHCNFPEMILQYSLIITCEPPPGLKQNLHRTLSLWSEKYVSHSNNPIRSQLLFVLAWFHAIIQERRTYIPCGWSKYYEFNESDLRASMDIIDSIFTKQTISNIGQLPWQLVWGLLSQAIYGGRIDNNIDLQTLNAYLTSYFNANTLSHTHSSAVPGSKWLSQIPKSVQKCEYLSLINALSNNDTPAMFGLPLNANNIVSLQSSKRLLQNLKVLSVSAMDTFSNANEGSVSSIDIQRKRVEPLLKLWKSIANSNDTIAIDLKGSHSNPTPIINAVSLEMEKVSLFINYINKTMIKIENGLFGNGSLTIDLRNNINELISGIVPWDWNKLWNKGNGPSNPKIFLTELVKRKQTLQAYMNKLKSNQKKNSFWKLNIVIGAFFYPITFLNAFKQYSAHKLKTTMDNIEFHCVWDQTALHKIGNNQSISILNIEGLYIEGALFDGRNVKHVSCKDVALSKAPLCYMYYDLKNSTNQNKNNNMQCIDVPVYYSLNRSYKVFDIKLSVESRLRWNLSGLAFIMTNIY